MKKLVESYLRLSPYERKSIEPLLEHVLVGYVPCPHEKEDEIVINQVMNYVCKGCGRIRSEYDNA